MLLLYLSRSGDYACTMFVNMSINMTKISVSLESYKKSIALCFTTFTTSVYEYYCSYKRKKDKAMTPLTSLSRLHFIYQTRKTAFDHISKQRVENTTRSGVLPMSLDVFRNVLKHHLSCILYIFSVEILR